MNKLPTGLLCDYVCDTHTSTHDPDLAQNNMMSTEGTSIRARGAGVSWAWTTPGFPLSTIWVRTLGHLWWEE